MMRHIFKQLWNRKRANSLMIIELFISFIVVFALFAGVVSTLLYTDKPTGYNVIDVYTARIQPHTYEPDSLEKIAIFETSGQLIDELKSMPEVIEVASLFPLPYGGSTISNVSDFRDLQDVRTIYVEASDRIFDVMDTRILDGRGFEESDDALDYIPSMVNQAFVDEYCNGKPPLGEALDEDATFRVVGIIEDFRYRGALTKRLPLMMTRRSLEVVDKGYEPIRAVVIKTHPGTTAEFEEEVQKLTENMHAGWTAQVNRLSQLREGHYKDVVSPLLMAGMIIGFLMLMVILGMIGVFWLAITRRTEEIGVRRAMGGSKPDIYRQFLGEIAALTTIAMGAASLLIVQIPLLGIIPELTWGNTIIALIVSAVFMYLIAMMSGLYPAWMAARVQPAAALHYE
ncbi:FtsX-like permease family protein [bacterium]|nr:FtsX-like permease family protein [bacterium]MBU1638657.1 FtsX-like permease family protein [bacterium]